jgi:hypothetical protein
MQCTRCGNELPDGATVCGFCGTAVAYGNMQQQYYTQQQGQSPQQQQYYTQQQVQPSQQQQYYNQQQVQPSQQQQYYTQQQVQPSQQQQYYNQQQVQPSQQQQYYNQQQVQPSQQQYYNQPQNNQQYNNYQYSQPNQYGNVYGQSHSNSILKKINVFTIIFAVILAISTILPLGKASFLGTSAEKSLMDGGDGWFFLIVAIIALILALKNLNVGVTVVGVIGLILMFIEVTSFADAASSSEYGYLLQKGSGYYLMVIGVIGVLVSGIVKLVVDKRKV